MKRIYITILLLAVTISVFSQKRMTAHKKDGTKTYLVLSAVDSLTFADYTDTLMVPVAGGTFTADATETTISSFMIDKSEVTYELWTAVRTWALVNGYSGLAAGQNGSSPVGTYNPVSMVDWYDVIKWCNARSEKEGLTPVYYTASDQSTVVRAVDAAINPDAVKWTANGYRPPTEAEWEFAAKGGSLAQSTPYVYSGSNAIDGVAWYGTNSGNTTHTVGSKTANELGIFDMSGNVTERCWDWYGTAYPSGGTTDPQGPSTAQFERVQRGGSCGAIESLCRVVYRNYKSPNTVSSAYGFRCVRD